MRGSSWRIARCLKASSSTTSTPARRRSAARIGGTGPPLLLLHGNPQTHVMWHKIAPRLPSISPSSRPTCAAMAKAPSRATTPDHEPYSKRAMARDQVALMRHFGFERFAVAGHDRGGRCAYRMALDHPERVEKLAVLDILPTLEHYRRTDMALRHGLLALVLPAAALSAAGEADRRRPGMVFSSATGRARASRRPSSIRRRWRITGAPSATRDRARHLRGLSRRRDLSICRLDEADFGKRKIACPLLVLWAREGYPAEALRSAGGLARLGRRRPRRRRSTAGTIWRRSGRRRRLRALLGLSCSPGGLKHPGRAARRHVAPLSPRCVKALPADRSRQPFRRGSHGRTHAFRTRRARRAHGLCGSTSAPSPASSR